MGRVVISRSLGGVMVRAVVRTDLSGKELHRQACDGTVVTSGSLGGVMVSAVVCTHLSGKEPHRHVGVVMRGIREPRWCNS